MTKQPSVATTGQNFQGSLNLTVDSASWQVAAQPPLQVQVLAQAPGSWLAIPSDASGGLRGGDSHRLAISLEAGTKLRWQPPAATIVYPVAAGSPAEAISHSETELRLGEATFLDFQARPIIPCRQARFKQTVTIRLRASSQLFFAEHWTAGRAAAGEIHDYDWLDSRLVLYVDGLLLHREAWHLSPTDQHLGSPAGLAQAQAWGLVIVRGEAARQELNSHFRPRLPAESEVVQGSVDRDTTILRYRTTSPFDRAVSFKP